MATTSSPADSLDHANQPQPSRIALIHLLKIRLCHDQFIIGFMSSTVFSPSLETKGQSPKIIIHPPVVILSDLAVALMNSIFMRGLVIGGFG